MILELDKDMQNEILKDDSRLKQLVDEALSLLKAKPN